MSKKISLIFLISVLFSPVINCMKIELKSKDGNTFKIDKQIAEKQSVFVADVVSCGDGGVTCIPVPIIRSKELALIVDLMKNAETLDVIELRKKIEERNLDLEEVGQLFIAANFLITEKILNALVDYFFDTPEFLDMEILKLRWAEFENLHELLSRFVTKYTKLNVGKEGFEKWFHKAKKLPGAAELISSLVWEIANKKINEGETATQEFFNSIKEEGLLKMALRIGFYEKYKKNIKDKIKFKRIIFSDLYSIHELKNESGSFVCIDIAYLPLAVISRSIGVKGSKIINIVLYLLLEKIKNTLDKKLLYINFELRGSFFLGGLYYYSSYFDFVKSIPNALYFSRLYRDKLGGILVSDAKIEELPWWIGELKELRELKLKYIETLKSLPEEIGKLSKLRELCLGYVYDLKSLPESIKDLESLKKLSIIEIGITSLPEWLGQMNGVDLRFKSVQ